MLTYFSWWYGQELAYIWRSAGNIIRNVFQTFSISVLLRTLFSPWKRDAYSAENVSLDVRMHLALDNLISRGIGFIIRIFTILTGLIFTVFAMVIMLVVILFWLCLPLVIIGLIVDGVMRLAGA
jgi:hypothetical protein